jgi:integrase
MSKKRGNTEGTIFKLENGTFRAQISLNGRRLSHSAKTEKECRDWLKKTITQIDHGLTFAGAQTYLEEFLLGWLRGIKQSIRPVTYYQYEMVCTRHIIPTLGKIKLKDLRPDQIQKLYAMKVINDQGYRTAQMVHTVLHMALKNAIKLGLLIRNPTEATTPPKHTEKEMKIWNEVEVSEFLLAVRGDRNEALYQLELATGLRQSEILALKWSDLDWTKRSLSVTRQLKRCGPENDYFSSPKTRAGRRNIILGTRTIEKLRDHLSRQESERKAKVDSNLYTSFMKLVKQLGLPDIRFHDLRHTSASLMVNHNIPIIVVSRRLGHSKVSIKLDIYAHLIPEMQEGAAELIDDLITPVEIQLHHGCTEEVKTAYQV